jgi:hypothetical protein
MSVKNNYRKPFFYNKIGGIFCSLIKSCVVAVHEWRRGGRCVRRFYQRVRKLLKLPHPVYNRHSKLYAPYTLKTCYISKSADICISNAQKCVLYA